MRVTISQTNLSKLLTSVAQYGNKASVGMEITMHALLKAEAEGNKISISGTNLETETTTTTSATIKDEGQILVPIKRLNSLVKSLPDVDIKLTLTKNGKLRINWGNSATIAVKDVEIFPNITTFDEDSDSVLVNVEALKTALLQVAFAANQDESRPILKGIYWNKMLQSADGYRASFVRIDTSNDNIIIPAKSLADGLHKLLNGNKVKMQNSGNKVIFKMEDDTVFTLNSIEGMFPQIDQFLDLETELKLIFNTRQLLSVMRQAEVFDNSGIGLAVTASSNGFDIDIQSENDEFQANIPAIETEGDKKIRFGLSTKYFSSSESGVLPRINTELVEVHLRGDGDDPITIKSGNFTHIIMPVKLSSGRDPLETPKESIRNADYKAEDY